jgi:Fe2+ transport system protein B
MNQPQDPNTEELLMLLLESMKEYRGAINDDRRRLEQFYKSVDKNIVQEFNNALNRSKSGIDANFSDSLSKAHARLQQSANLLDEKTKVLNQTANRLDHNFDNRFLILYSSIFIGLVVVVVMFLYFFVPSWDEIKQRRQLAERYNMEVQMCTVDNTAKPCVRVMKKLCNYGENHDLCVIDPK